MVKITISVSKLDDLGAKMPLIRKEGLKNVALDMVGTLDRNSPIDQGVLHKWAIIEHTDDEYKIRSPAHYAEYVNDGTGIYGKYHTPIVHPVIGKKFAFQVGGKMVYTNIIKGQKGQHFVERSMDEVIPRIPNRFKTAIEKVLQ